MEIIKRKSWVKIKIIFFLLMLTTIMFFSGKNSVFAVNVEDIRAEIKCPDHDRPEIVFIGRELN